MSTLTKSLFVEEEYLELYPEVAAAVRTGVFDSGRSHYLRHGRAEGRAGFRFDDEWYARSYPLAVHEVAQGLTGSLASHYQQHGVARGYLPYPEALRPDNPASLPSRFGGMWVDQLNSRDIVAGQLEIGRITAQQADRLLSFIVNGYVVIEKGVSDDEVDRALEDLERAFNGEIDGLAFQCPNVGRGSFTQLQSVLRTKPAKALDLHYFSNSVRDLILSDKVADFLMLLFNARPFISQTLGFYRGSAQGAHQDTAYVPYTAQRGFVASWIALEDVSQNAGELFYIPGSHTLEDFLYADRFKSISEATRSGCRAELLTMQEAQHVKSLEPRAASHGMSSETFLARRGDVLIWHADLAHGGKPISSNETRRSIVTHYCSKYASPIFAEQFKAPFHDHKGKGFYTTSHYPAEFPR